MYLTLLKYADCYRTAPIISLSINISIIINCIYHLLFILYFKVLFHLT